MTTDLMLAIAHHVPVFGLVAVLASEIALVRVGITTATIRLLGILDAGYGLLAAAVLGAGFLRVFYGLRPEQFYLQNPIFWTKIGAFLIIGLVSVWPTLRILAWRRRLKNEPAYSPPAREIRFVRGLFALEAVLFVPLLICAAAMARGYGLL